MGPCPSAATLLATMTLLFTSCEKNNTDLNPEKETTITLIASTESASDTKTVLGGDPMTQVHWSANDQVQIYAGTDNAIFSATPMGEDTKHFPDPLASTS